MGERLLQTKGHQGFWPHQVLREAGYQFSQSCQKVTTADILISESGVYSCDLPRWPSDQESACSAGDARDAGSIPGSGRPPGEENGNPLQYSCLESAMDRGAWQAILHGVTKSWIRWSYRATQLWEYKFQFFSATSLQQFVMAALRKPPSTSRFLLGALIFFKAVTVLSASLKEVIKNFWWLTSQLTTTGGQKLGEHLKRNVKDTWMSGYRKMTLPFKMWLTGWI